MTSGSQQAYVSYDAYGQAWIYPYDCGSEGALELLPDAANFSSSSSYQGELHSPDSLAPSPMVMTPDGACYPPNTQYDAWSSNMCGETSIAPACGCPNCVGVYIDSGTRNSPRTFSVVLTMFCGPQTAYRPAPQIPYHLTSHRFTQRRPTQVPLQRTGTTARSRDPRIRKIHQPAPRRAA